MRCPLRWRRSLPVGVRKSNRARCASSRHQGEPRTDHRHTLAERVSPANVTKRAMSKVVDQVSRPEVQIGGRGPDRGHTGPGRVAPPPRLAELRPARQTALRAYLDSLVRSEYRRRSAGRRRCRGHPAGIRISQPAPYGSELTSAGSSSRSGFTSLTSPSTGEKMSLTDLGRLDLPARLPGRHPATSGGTRRRRRRPEPAGRSR